MERFDRGNKFILKTILNNDRLNAYEFYIKYAENNGYNVCGLEKFYENRDDGNKYFVLRHDVDIVSEATEEMFLKEKALGVTSTYYFRFSTIDVELIKKMEDAGFEVGFHFETLANYANEFGIERIDEISIEKVQEKLKMEIDKFEKTTNITIKSLASHGHPLNRKLGYSNNYILENESYSKYNILFEAYDKELYNKYIDSHIMDNNICFNSGFSYNENPIEEIDNKKARIVFLSHPNYWYGNNVRKVKDLVYFFSGRGKKYQPTTFKRIALGE